MLLGGMMTVELAKLKGIEIALLRPPRKEDRITVFGGYTDFAERKNLRKALAVLANKGLRERYLGF